MTNPTWPIGPARTRSDFYEAEVLKTDMGGDWPLLVRYRGKDSCEWSVAQLTALGKMDKYGAEHGRDLLPPKLTRDEAIAECVDVVRAQRCARGNDWYLDADDAITHWEKLQAEGRIE